MSKLFAILFLAAFIAVASAQYLAAYPRAGYVGSPVLGRAAYAPLGYGGLGYGAGYAVPRAGVYYG